MNRFSLILLLSLGACKMASGTSSTTTPPTGGGGGGGGGNPAWAGTMAEAQKQSVPATLEVKPQCHQDTYIILDVAEGKDFEIEIKPADGCVHLSVMKENGSTNDMPNAEVCVDASPKTIQGKGQAGKTFISMNETGACKGVSATLTIK